MKNRIPGFIYIILLALFVFGASICTSAQNLNDIDSVEVGVKIENDSVYSILLKHHVPSNVELNGMNSKKFAFYRGYTSDKNFWLGTGSLAVAAGWFVAAAWSDPVVYVETHNKYTRNYFNKAINKRNGKMIVGFVFTGAAVYFYSKLRGKKRVRWVVGPDGIKYTF
jgi:hypothetical protein